MNSLALLKSEGSVLQSPSKPVRVLGIDLGTTNSTIADVIWNPGDPAPAAVRCLEVDQFTFEGIYTHVLVPSIVAIHRGKVIVGEGAKRLRSQASDLELDRNQNLFYECKNEIGVERTYHRAPEGFGTAAEIGSKVLGFLHKAALEYDDIPVSRTVVTVPASFQTAQRHDTLKAAKLAGLDLVGGDLLDEPVAAFLDYLISHSDTLLPEFSQPKNLVVFDFGGGTCDVAVFHIEMPTWGGRLKTVPLSVSRYHRLGGGDIDAAIVYEVLIPQLSRQNNVEAFEFSFEDKKRVIEPGLLGVAESLKVGLCIDIARLQSFGQYETADKSQIVKKNPVVQTCNLKGRALTLQSPQLTAEQFEALLKPFLDQDLLYARETEYRMTCSIFAPLQDALDRSGLDKTQIDYCLMMGGSSLIPQVIQTVTGFFPQAKVLTYPDRDSTQTAVAKGAAYHALALAVFGKGLVRPICHDRIAIRTASGLVEIIPKGVDLPYPSGDAHGRCDALAVPEAKLTGDVELRVEIVAGSEERKLFSELWRIPGPVNRGSPLCLEFRYDENQILDFRMRLVGRDEAGQFVGTVVNPLTHVVNPHSTRLKIDEIEEDLRTGKVPSSQVSDNLVDLAEMYAEIGQREKALEFLKRALQAKNRPDAGILNKMAIYCGEMGDFEREEKLYREAAMASSWSGPWFNLALAQRRRGNHKEAVESVEKVLAMDRQAPYLVLRAMLASDLGNQQESGQFLRDALAIFAPVSSMSDWELGWLLTAARMAGDTRKEEEAKAEQMKRIQNRGRDEEEQGLLPIPTPIPQKVM